VWAQHVARTYRRALLGDRREGDRTALASRWWGPGPPRRRGSEARRARRRPSRAGCRRAGDALGLVVSWSTLI
jgi:hypothetical protein